MISVVQVIKLFLNNKILNSGFKLKHDFYSKNTSAANVKYKEFDAKMCVNKKKERLNKDLKYEKKFVNMLLDPVLIHQDACLPACPLDAASCSRVDGGAGRTAPAAHHVPEGTAVDVVTHRVALGGRGHAEQRADLRVERHVAAHGQDAAQVDLDAVLLRQNLRLQSRAHLEQASEAQLRAPELLVQRRYRLTKFVDLRLQSDSSRTKVFLKIILHE